MRSERAITNLIAKYSHFLDDGDFAGAAALFDYGKIVSFGDDVKGQAQVEKYLRDNLQVYQDGTLKTAHVISNTVLNIDETDTRAAGVSYVTLFQQDDEYSFPLQPIMVGRYNDTFARLDGKWHFIKRRIYIILKGDLSHHVRPDGPSVKRLK